MQLSPEDRKAVLELAAKAVADAVIATMDPADLITLPIGVVVQMTGFPRAHIINHWPTRNLGGTKVGVSLKILQQKMCKP